MVVNAHEHKVFTIPQFIVAKGSISVVVYSSQNAEVCDTLLVPLNLVGLSKTVLMSHIVVESPGEFAKFAMDADDLKLL